MKTLCERCIETLSRNLDMYDCLELLPEFIIEKILLRMKQFFQGRLGKLNDESVVGYLTMLHQQSCVTSLNLPWCNKITNDGCVNITQQLPSLCLRLTTINLSYCHNIDDSSIQVLAKACPALVGIDLTFTAVGDRGIVPWCNTATHLWNDCLWNNVKTSPTKEYKPWPVVSNVVV
jgi:hypothetical protein